MSSPSVTPAHEGVAEASFLSGRGPHGESVDGIMSNSADIPPAVPGSRPALGLAVTSLVLGILAVVLSLFLIGAFLGLVGLVFGVLHLRRSQVPRGMAGWGVALSGLAIVASAAFGLMYYTWYQAFEEMMAAGEVDLSVWEGVVAPDITVKSLDGETIQLSQLRGKRVILDFWATWCGPCVMEIPHFVQLVNEIPPEDLAIVGISSEDEATLRQFVKSHGVNYPIASADVSPPPYSDVYAIPTTFVIDRNGVIQSVLTGYHDLTSLRALATAADYAGEPKSAPEPPASGLQEAPEPLQPVSRWSRRLPGALAMCAGDWDGDGRSDLLVAERGRTLRVIGFDGAQTAVLSLPDDFTMIEMGVHKDSGPRLLGYSNWGREVTVMDRTGRKIWTYASSTGVNGAHWGDLDGDGSDELVVGMNGSGGLHAVSDSGQRLWRVGDIGNVWTQAVVPAGDGRPALVFATEAGGSVKIYDGRGNLLRTARPLGEYFAQMTAAYMNGDGAVQIIASGVVTVAFDESGRVAWSTPAVDDQGSWRNGSFACGDMNGDGAREWIFIDITHELVVVTAAGEKLAALPAPRNLDAFCVIPGTDGRDLLVTLQSGVVQAHAFE